MVALLVDTVLTAPVAVGHACVQVNQDVVHPSHCLLWTARHDLHTMDMDQVKWNYYQRKEHCFTSAIELKS